MNNQFLALGLPTYKRPDFAIKLIADALELDVYDEIIVSCNSREPSIEIYIESLGDNNKVIYNLQDENVGLSQNYADIISLSSCRYIHIVSDEDSLDAQNAKKLYQFIEGSSVRPGVICLSVLDEFGEIYKDTSTQTNNYIANICSDAGHIGTTAINREQWDEGSINIFSEYSKRLGSVYPTVAAAILAYAKNPQLIYFPKHIVTMGPKHETSEIRGHGIYGFSSRAYQLMSLIDLAVAARITGLHRVFFYMVYFFSSHAFIDSYIKFEEDILALTNRCLLQREFSFLSKILLIVAVNFFYLIRLYRFLRLFTAQLLKTFIK